MRRESKKEEAVRLALAESARFAALPFRTIRTSGEPRLRDKAWFIPVCRYGRYWFVQRGELGVIENVRYKTRTRKGEQ